MKASVTNARPRQKRTADFVGGSVPILVERRVVPPYRSVDPAKNSHCTTEDTARAKSTTDIPSPTARDDRRRANGCRPRRRYGHVGNDSGFDPPGIARWGAQAGSMYFADQKVPLTVPRVHSGVSCREYEAVAEAVPGALGLAKSSVSRRFVRTSATALRQLHEPRHDDRGWLVLLFDGKTFAVDRMRSAQRATAASRSGHSLSRSRPDRHSAPHSASAAGTPRRC
jgi:hypothetical protein